MVVVVDPYSGAYAAAALPSEWESNQPTQTLVVADGYAVDTALDDYTIEEPPPPPPPVVVAEVEPTKSSSSSSSRSSSSAAPAAGTPDPGSAKAVALEMVSARGWDDAQYNCLVSLWNKESGWNMYAQNKSSGAYGIPQSLPGSKMASAGADWATNAATQISWGLGYISGRYQTPCGAWTHSQAVGWY
ncbi:lytic transglycosylase domain-containing protein [Glaciihabitans tibetensis]